MEHPRRAGQRVAQPTTITLQIHDHRTATVFTELVALTAGLDKSPTHRRINNGDERPPSPPTTCAEHGSSTLSNEAGSGLMMSSFYTDVGYGHIEDMDLSWI